MKFKRARNEDQIELRRQEILNACKKLLMEQGYEDTTLLAISKLISVGRTTIYNYYPTKEDLFMELCTIETETIIKELNDLYEHADKNNKDEEFKKILMTIFIKYKYLFDYYAMYVAKVLGKANKEVTDAFQEKVTVPFKDFYKKLLLFINPNLTHDRIVSFNNILWVFFTGINTLTYNKSVYEDSCKFFVEGTLALLKK